MIGTDKVAFLSESRRFSSFFPLLVAHKPAGWRARISFARAPLSTKPSIRNEGDASRESGEGDEYPGLQSGLLPLKRVARLFPAMISDSPLSSALPMP